MKRAILATCAACTAPVVQMKLEFSPTDMTDTSCVSAVEVRAIGTSYQQDPTDYKHRCLSMTGATYAQLDAAMHDEYDVELPGDGLAGIEIFGWTGASPCDPSSFTDSNGIVVTPDLIFYASGAYIGQETITLPVTQNLACARANVAVHVTDVIQLVSGANPTDANCTSATAVMDGNAQNNLGVATGTFAPDPFAHASEFFGNNDGGDWAAGIAKFPGFTQAGPKSCVALVGGNNTGGSTSCAIANPVCPGSGAPGELELSAIPTAIVDAAYTLNQDVLKTYPGLVIGSVWTGTTSKHPVTGATLALAASEGQVVYVDPPAAGSSDLVVRGDQSGTGPSGMFLLYTNTVAQVAVKGGNPTRTVTLAAMPVKLFNAAALILVN